MHIISKTVKIERPKELTVNEIYEKLGFEPIRWAIVDADENLLTISCSYAVE